MNRTFDILPYLALICLSLAVLSGCKKVDVPSDDLSQGLVPSGTPITFETEYPASKSIINSKEDLEQEGNAFKVFAWFDGTTDGHMFGEEGTDVTFTNDKGWTYSPVRYWMNGTYDFSAVYSSTVNPRTEGASPTLTVPDFDVTSQEDLLIAFNNDIDGNNHPDKVDLTFKHALSNIQIQLSLDKDAFGIEMDQSGNIVKQVGYAFVSLIGFENISTKATLNATSFENMIWTSTERGNQMLSYVDDMPEIKAEWIDFLGKDGLMTIPQSLVNANGELYMMIVIYPLGNASDRITKEYRIPLTSGVSEWLPNTKYIYSGVVTQELVIDFRVTKVNDWESENLGGFIVS